MSIILKVENVSKQYRLGLVGTGTLSHDLNRWWHRIRGKPDPYLKVGAVNDRSARATQDYVWALRDISFEVEKGEVLGIIGKNGAGKSTMLKILSRVTGPTTGSIKTKGRIASLLEVGTGFHPELTGRENIFLNGAILGMTKSEISDKLEEIISFSGCEMYIDTPVKRYSSGMRVRLAFSVAAHLEPDILVVDEVLAVGDAEFQKKAIGKMQDISNADGRTVIFVSHDMPAIIRLCSRVVLLDNGYVDEIGPAEYIVNKYLQGKADQYVFSATPTNGKKAILLKEASLKKASGELMDGAYDVMEDFQLSITLETTQPMHNPVIAFHFRNLKDEIVMLSDIHDDKNNVIPRSPGIHQYTIRLEQPLLKPDRYFVHIGIVNRDTGETNHFPALLNFELIDKDNERSTRAGYIYQKLAWKRKDQ